MYNSSTTPPTLSGTVQAAAPGLVGFDTVETISSTTAKQFKNLGYSFCIRYISLGNAPGTFDITIGEAKNILSAGLALSIVQQSAGPGWTVSTGLGTTNGNNAVTNAQALGLPTAMVIWCDLESPAADTSADDLIAYCQEWYAAVNAANYVPGLYVGACNNASGDPILSSQQLYDLSFQHYWQSQSDVPEVETRGYQMSQLYPSVTVANTVVDIDITNNDNLGGTVLWLSL